MLKTYLKENKISKIMFSSMLVAIFALAFGPSLYAQFSLLIGNTDDEGYGYGYGYDGRGYGYGYGYDSGKKVTICHARGNNGGDPYVTITISENGLRGHSGHGNDIIPAPAGGCPPTIGSRPTNSSGGGGGGGGGGIGRGGQVLGTSTPDSLGYGYGSIPFPGTEAGQCFTPPFTQDFRMGARSEQVRQLQVYLNNHNFPLTNGRGAGSLGRETNMFAGLTRNALIKFQDAHNIPSSEHGTFGPQTRAALNILLNTAQLPICQVAVQTFTSTLRVGSSNEQVRMLQVYLNNHGFQIANRGVGSPGNESTHFGGRTRAALIRLQRAVGITGENGMTGEKTRNYLNSNP